MRIFQAILGLLVTGAVVTACTINQNDCEKNPELTCYSHGGGGGGTTSTGAGGTGGGTCMSETECPIPADKCKERACESGACGSKDKDCGMLTCNSMTGMCEGCDDNDPMKKCPDKPCHDVACKDEICDEKPNGALPCAGGMGTCDDLGNCGPCNDGLQNGDETGIDCGPFTCGACNGEMCEAGTNCHSEFCVDGVCCDVACDGLCQACNLGGAEGSCKPIPVGTPDTDGGVSGKTCGANVGGCGVTAGYCGCDDGKKNGDETDVDCGGETCGEKCGTGHSCTVKGDCIGDECADGYCCNAACTGACESCSLPGREGLCSVVSAGTIDAECTGTDVCGTGGLCTKPLEEGCSNTDSKCASNKCANNNKCAACAQDADCGANRVCEAGACYAVVVNGQACPSDKVCDSGHCVDGVCCDTVCTGLCMARHLNYNYGATGTCAPIHSGYDPHKECPLPDPAQPGPGGSAYCSGADPDANGNSSCAQPQP